MAISDKAQALLKLAKRKAHPPPQIDNARLPAGSEMYYYCKLCGHQSDVLPESHWGRPRQLCTECQWLKDMGWLE